MGKLWDKLFGKAEEEEEEEDDLPQKHTPFYVAYCPFCGDIDRRYQNETMTCTFCNNRMTGMQDHEVDYFMDISREKKLQIEKETGVWPETSWKDVAFDYYKVAENPLFDRTLYNQRLYKSGERSSPGVVCPSCHSQNTYELNPSGKTEYSGWYGSVSSNFGKTFGCNSCGYKW